MTTARKGFKEFVNRIYGLLPCPAYLSWVASPAEILKEMERYRVGKPAVPYDAYTVEIRDGCLYVDGNIIMRAACEDHPYRSQYTEELDFLEGRCLGDCAD